MSATERMIVLNNNKYTQQCLATAFVHAHTDTHTYTQTFLRDIFKSLCQTTLTQRDAEMSDTLHGQDLQLAFGCQRGRHLPLLIPQEPHAVSVYREGREEGGGGEQTVG